MNNIQYLLTVIKHNFFTILISQMVKLCTQINYCNQLQKENNV